MIWIPAKFFKTVLRWMYKTLNLCVSCFFPPSMGIIPPISQLHPWPPYLKWHVHHSVSPSLYMSILFFVCYLSPILDGKSPEDRAPSVLLAYLYLQHLKQCLAHSNCSANVSWMKGWMNSIAEWLKWDNIYKMLSTIRT